MVEPVTVSRLTAGTEERPRSKGGEAAAVLDSRSQNLHALPEKRTEAGVAQARLAVQVARAFIRGQIRERGERTGLKLLERVASIALDIAAVRVFLLYGVDPLEAVPLPEFRTTSALHKVRWPQIVTEARDKREALRRVLSDASRRT